MVAPSTPMTPGAPDDVPNTPAPLPPAGPPAVAGSSRPAGAGTPRPAGAPRPPGARRPAAKAPPSRPGRRVFLTLVVLGLVLIGIGGGLALTWYPLVVHSTNAATFLTQADATLTTNQGSNYVYFASSYYHAGQTVVIQDTVKSANFNASSDTTSLTFTSIANNANLAPVLGPLATNLFGTLEGKVSWIGSNTPVVLTFTVVQVQLPGGPSGSGTYMTLDAAADASYRAITQGLTGPAAVAILPQYVQGYPALQYDGLFYFLIGAGVAIVLVGYLYSAKLEAWLIRETKEPKTLPVLFIGFLGILGGSFVPFYPWPFVLLIAGAVMLVAWKFPQLSLLILVLFITPAVAYQSGALGLVFLFATVPILFASLIDWRFGAGVFLTLLLAPFGLSFIGPVFFALIFSLYLGLAVAVAGGILVSLFVTLGNFPVFGYLTGPGGNGTVSLVSGHSAPLLPTLPIPFFTANAIGSAYASVLNPNLSQLANGGSGLGALPVPLAEIGVWCLAIWLITTVTKDRSHLTTDNVLRYSTYSGALVAGGTAAGLVAFGYLGWSSIAVVLLVPAMLTAVVAALILRDAFEAYFTSRLGGTAVGTRVAEMKNLVEGHLRHGRGPPRRQGGHQGVDDRPAAPPGRHDPVQAGPAQGDPPVRPARLREDDADEGARHRARGRDDLDQVLGRHVQVVRRERGKDRRAPADRPRTRPLHPVHG
jgi:hypothetical protein